MMLKPMMPVLAILVQFATPAHSEVIKLPVATSEVFFDEIASRWTLIVRLTPGGASDFGAFTSRHVGEKVTLRLADRILVEPVIVEPIRGGGLFIPLTGSKSSALLLKEDIASRGGVIEVEGIDK